MTPVGGKTKFVDGSLILNKIVWTPMMLNAAVSRIEQLSQTKLHQISLEDGEAKLRQIGVTLKTAEGSIFNVLYDHVAMRELFLKWVPARNNRMFAAV